MRISLRVLVVIFTLTLVPAFAPAQQLEPFTQGMFFDSYEDCEAAYLAGTGRGYLPAPEHLLKVPLKEAKGLLQDYCVREDPRGESKIKDPWMILLKSTPALMGRDGKPTVDGRCGNKIYFARALPLPTGPRGPVGERGPQGPVGATGPQGPAGVTPRLIVPPPAPAVVTRPEEAKPWPIRITPGIGGLWAFTDLQFTCPPNCPCEVRQQDESIGPALSLRIEQPKQGLFVEGSGAHLHVYDATYPWVGERHSNNRNARLSGKAGYQWSSFVKVGLSVNADYLNLRAERSYTTYGFGAEVAMASKDDKTAIIISGKAEPWGHNDVDQHAAMYGAGAEIDRRLQRHIVLYIEGALEARHSSRFFSGILEDEYPRTYALGVGLKFPLGGK